jgi:hypothetical protein
MNIYVYIPYWQLFATTDLFIFQRIDRGQDQVIVDPTNITKVPITYCTHNHTSLQETLLKLTRKAAGTLFPS